MTLHFVNNLKKTSIGTKQLFLNTTLARVVRNNLISNTYIYRSQHYSINTS